MSIAREIVSTWRAPRAAFRRQLAAGQREDRALAYVMVACLLIFVSKWPGIARAAYLDPQIPLEGRLAGALFGWVALAPLFFYALAGFSHLFARMMGGQGSHFGARLALFWTLLALSPAFLLYGLVAGFLGAGVVTNVIATLLAVAFLAIWLLSLKEAEAVGRA